jgi:phage shock protein A
MIFGKLWQALAAQFNKLANFFWGSDPISVMQYEYDQAVGQLRDGREGLERYRALVERVNNQVEANRTAVARLEARTKAYLQAGDRDTAARFALELQKAKKELEDNAGQLKMHEDAYNNNLLKIKSATGKLAQLREKIQKYDAELKMSKAEAEVAKLAQDFHFDVTTDFGQIEQVVQDRINQNRARARVAADLSAEGVEDIRHEEAAEKAMAEDALKQFEAEMGLRTPETTRASEEPEIGPAKKTVTKEG